MKKRINPTDLDIQSTYQWPRATRSVMQQSAEKAIPRPKAYIFDIDATLLSSKGGPIFRGRADIPAFNNWALKSNAPAIPAGKKLYDQAIAEGAEIHLLTGREPLIKKATIRNLQEQGMGVFHGYYTKPTDVDTVTFKAGIRAKLAETHDIVATIGDSPTDFWGGNTGKAVRVVSEAHTSEFKRARIAGLFEGQAAKRAQKILSFGDAYYRPVAYAAAAATAAFVAIRLASGKRNDRQTQIVGLPSFGKAAGLRHKLTDFGSGYRGPKSKEPSAGSIVGHHPLALTNSALSGFIIPITIAGWQIQTMPVLAQQRVKDLATGLHDAPFNFLKRFGVQHDWQITGQMIGKRAWTKIAADFYGRTDPQYFHESVISANPLFDILNLNPLAKSSPANRVTKIRPDAMGDEVDKLASGIKDAVLSGKKAAGNSLRRKGVKWVYRGITADQAGDIKQQLASSGQAEVDVNALMSWTARPQEAAVFASANMEEAIANKSGYVIRMPFKAEHAWADYGHEMGSEIVLGHPTSKMTVAAADMFELPAGAATRHFYGDAVGGEIGSKFKAWTSASHNPLRSKLVPLVPAAIGVGFGAVLVARKYHKLRDKDQADFLANSKRGGRQTQITGLHSGGKASHSRHSLTDFGSGWLGLSPERQALLEAYKRDKANKTEIWWKPVDIPEGPPTFVSKTGTKYWETEETVVRVADHWGKFLGGSVWPLEGVAPPSKHIRLGREVAGIAPMDVFRKGISSKGEPLIAGLAHGGVSEKLRRFLTRFGSGWQGLESKTVRDTPSRFLKLIGADAESIRATDLQHGRYQEPAQIQELIQAYKSGKTVEPVEILLDEAKNIVGAEGRHRALAAQMAGIEKFPIVLRHKVAEDVKLVKSVMKAGEGAAIGKAGTAKVPAVLKSGARLIRNAL